jgi:hypothetical protein
MKPMLWFGVICGVVTIIFLALTTEVLCPPEAEPCTQAWFLYLDKHYLQAIDADNDADGGPNLGDPVWSSWFEGAAKIWAPPQLSEQQRCQLIQKTLQERIYIVNQAFGRTFILKMR